MPVWVRAALSLLAGLLAGSAALAVAEVLWPGAAAAVWHWITSLPWALWPTGEDTVPVPPPGGVDLDLDHVAPCWGDKPGICPL